MYIVDEPHLLAEWNRERNDPLGLNPCNLTHGSKKKVWWKCKAGHEWEAAICNRANGNGCPICAGKRVLIGYNDFKTTDPESAAEWHPTKNGDLRPEMVTVGSNKKVWWLCQQGHEWEALICKRRETGCPFCSGRKILPGYNDLATTHPELAKEWHLTKNGDLKPEMVVVGSEKKVWWKCRKGHEWSAAVYSRKCGTGCPMCARESRVIARQRMILKNSGSLAETNPAIAAEWHPIRNGNLTPAMVTIGSNKKVWWKCAAGHEWEAIICSRKRAGCAFCSGRQTLPGQNDLATTYPDLAAEWHFEKNGDLLPNMITAGSEKRVWWKCTKGHEWEAVVYSRKSGRECPICARESGVIERQQTLLNRSGSLSETHPELAKEWHPAKNGDLSSDMVTAGSEKRVWWQCAKGHEWEAVVYSRKSGRGCPTCEAERQTSFPEQAIFYYISKVYEAENRFTLQKKELDVYIPELKTGIEYNGRFFHRGAEERDAKKRSFFSTAGIRVITVVESNENRITGDVVAYCGKRSNYSELGWAIREIFRLLDGQKNAPDIDIVRDRMKIWNRYIASEKERSIAATHPELAREWHPTKNGVLTPDMVTSGANKKVWWQCLKGHEWEAMINSRAIGRGCPICTGRKVLAGYNDLKTTYPELAKEWHPTKNGALEPNMVTAGVSKRAWWICPKGHEWETRISHRTNMKSGCPVCAGQKVLAGYNDLKTTYPELAKEWHPTKNVDLTPEMISAGSEKKVWWKCAEGHEWEAVICNRKAGNGCPVCARNRHEMEGQIKFF